MKIFSYSDNNRYMMTSSLRLRVHIFIIIVKTAAAPLARLCSECLGCGTTTLWQHGYSGELRFWEVRTCPESPHTEPRHLTSEPMLRTVIVRNANNEVSNTLISQALT